MIQDWSQQPLESLIHQGPSEHFLLVNHPISLDLHYVIVHSINLPLDLRVLIPQQTYEQMLHQIASCLLHLGLQSRTLDSYYSHLQFIQVRNENNIIIVHRYSTCRLLSMIQAVWVTGLSIIL